MEIEPPVRKVLYIGLIGVAMQWQTTEVDCLF